MSFERERGRERELHALAKGRQEDRNVKVTGLHGDSVVPQYARRNLRHCVQYTQYAAVPQCDAASYTVLLKLRVVPFDVFHCGHSNSANKVFSPNILFLICLRGKYL